MKTIFCECRSLCFPVYFISTFKKIRRLSFEEKTTGF
nr:MAG TPA: Defensin alpha-related sequence 1 antimicrobial peptide, cysteine-rich peptide [Caudoviricetes sp.]